ncbi:MAG: hypothetical protein A2836_01310 [Candidatus Taylorbacteria bacterium RIFCSPHIGHO2_01_FULL_45_63]|uniref:Plasmid stabilization protein n=1 Tax=Candidatus Taylorbacteria bacterium RIFCSPHIGHO2_02_FULL_45_35 TaxID=1802311 RepID=A0A1G2MPG4_9BACT|nr:MAG: hypothetical protein A2836_01310 [Candidatus Taylorbacteria bacterium RIFCSPHIGHO2_01_FULL_45_63]OHA25787.1 MAG: hypothetical protein A3D56_01640 [Candidatus Taylorbacteria bacterium RIFCSPHIGHO2_02_FULL_45_35]OHA32304.1 MAG: hypothetical protein A3A22_01855 [Candidatus Taylorbacteria bacterium RIFCSPLOWO2_01_FULL_45_34b]
MSWRVFVASSATKFVQRLPRKDATRIKFVLEKELSRDPYAGDIKKLAGEDNVWRRRVGSYRIFFEVYPVFQEVRVFDIERRGSNTY